jgi:hypothetical protein
MAANILRGYDPENTKKESIAASVKACKADLSIVYGAALCGAARPVVLGREVRQLR